MSEFSVISQFRPQVKKVWKRRLSYQLKKGGNRFPNVWEIVFDKPSPESLLMGG